MHLKSLPQYLDIELTDMVAAHVSLRFGMFSITFSERNKKPVKKIQDREIHSSKLKYSAVKAIKLFSKIMKFITYLENQNSVALVSICCVYRV
jgi:hypothetical protein